METTVGPEALLPLLIVLMFGQAAGCGILAQVIADSKGHSGIRWFWIGFCLSIVGVLWAAKLPDLRDR